MIAFGPTPLVTQPTITVPIVGGGLLQPRRVHCVGRNFAAHAREMGGAPEREPPFFFAKPRDALVVRPRALPLPPQSEDVQHEVELVLVLSRGGADLTPAAAEAAIGWCGVGVDLTRRDLQAAAKAAGRPWALAKGFDASAPIGTLVAWPGSAAMAGRSIALSVGEQVRQRGSLDDMIWSPAEIVATLSASVRLEPGDVVFCGTPAGVAALAAGDRVEASIDGLPPLRFSVAARGEALAPATSPDDVLALWFGPGDQMKRWFARDAAFDAALAERFGDDVAAARAGELDHWAHSARGRLALVVLLDQFSRNIHRGTPLAFAADAAARRHAAAAVDLGEDRILAPRERAFLYLPFEHGETMAHQDRSCGLFAQLVLESDPEARGMSEAMLDYAHRHRAVIAEYGRFPHRNAILGRTDTEAEVAYLAQPGAGF